jgi:polysaccharide export outer membrane protein
MTIRWWLTSGKTAAALCLAGWLAGCVPAYADYDAFMKKPRPVVGGKAYVIEPPDAINIIAPGAPEIDTSGGGAGGGGTNGNNGAKALRPDGMITLYLLGDVFAAGKTPSQLAAEIQEKILHYYEDVTVQIEVVGFNSKFYYMAGETAIGPRPYTGHDTVLRAVLQSGIPRTSWPSHCVVLRPNEEGELIRRMRIDLKDMYEKGDLKYNALLEEGDIIFLPTNPVADVGIFIQNLLSPVQPAISAASTPASVTGIPRP